MESTDAAERAAPTSQSRPDAVGLPHWITILILLVACSTARLLCLVCKPFWFDEAYTVELARLDWRNFVHVLWWREANMSLYYLLLRGWLHLGQSPFLIRSLSVVLSVATVPAIYWLARLLYSRRVALIAAAIFTFNGYSVRYAQEARSYALFLLLATLSSGFLIAWLHEPTRRNRTGYILTTVLAVYAHFYAILLVASQWLALRWDNSQDDNRRKELRSAWVRIGVAVLPLLVFIAKTGAGPIKWIPRPSLRNLAEFYMNLSGGNSWILLVAYAGCCVAAVMPLRRKLPARCQFLLVWVLFPVALAAVLSLARPVFLPRYLIFTLPALVILVAAGIARLRNAWLLGTALATVLLLNTSGVLYVYGHDFDTERDASGAATSFVLGETQPGDGIIFHIAATRVSYEFFRSMRAREYAASSHSSGNIGPEILFPNHGPGLDYRDFTGKPAADFLRGVAEDHPRIWVMLMNNGRPGQPDPTTDTIERALAESFSKLTVWSFRRVEVRLYSK